MSFQRPNLHFSARKREGGMEGALSEVLARCRDARKAGQPPEPTLVYALTTNQVRCGCMLVWLD